MSDEAGGGGARVVVLFRSVHDAMYAEKVCKEHGLWCDLVPTPHKHSTDCGMALQVLATDAPVLQELRAKLVLAYREIHPL